jgi:hypothetical protein
LSLTSVKRSNLPNGLSPLITGSSLYANRATSLESL